MKIYIIEENKKVDVNISLKSFITRKLKREINEKMFKETKYTSDGNAEINIQNLDIASDFTILSMISDATSGDGKNIEVNQEFIDNMDNDSFDRVKEAVDKILTKELPKEK